MSYETVSGEIKSSEKKVNNDSETATFVVNNFIRSITFSSPDGEITIKDLQIYTFKDLNLAQDHKFKLANQVKTLQAASIRIRNLGDKVSDALTKLEEGTIDLEEKQDSWKTKLADLKQDEELLREDIELHETNRKIAQTKYDECFTEAESIAEELQESKAALRAAREETSTLSQSKVNYENEIKNLKVQYAEQKAALRELEKDVDVFSEDLRDYTKETRLQTWFYGVLGVFMIGIIACVTVSVLNRSTALIELFDKQAIDSIIDVILSRIPFTIAVLGILTLSGEGLRRSINRLIDIHDQRLSFYRISIAARDITDVSYEGVEVSRDELVKTRLETKMKLL